MSGLKDAGRMNSRKVDVFLKKAVSSTRIQSASVSSMRPWSFCGAKYRPVSLVSPAILSLLPVIRTGLAGVRELSDL